MAIAVPKPVAQPSAFSLNELKFDQYEPQKQILHDKAPRTRRGRTTEKVAPHMPVWTVKQRADIARTPLH
jgi:hypothetical protein